MTLQSKITLLPNMEACGFSKQMRHCFDSYERLCMCVHAQKERQTHRERWKQTFR